MRLAHPVPIAFARRSRSRSLASRSTSRAPWLLSDDHHHHGHGHDDHADHDHAHHHARDLNLRSAYVHVLADAATSVLAIVGLLAAGLFGWVFMDPVVGLVGTGVILSWAWGLVRDAGAVLLDTVPDPALAGAIRERLEVGGDRVSDLHLGGSGRATTRPWSRSSPTTRARPRPTRRGSPACPASRTLTVEVEILPGRRTPEKRRDRGRSGLRGGLDIKPAGIAPARPALSAPRAAGPCGTSPAARGRRRSSARRRPPAASRSRRRQQRSRPAAGSPPRPGCAAPRSRSPPPRARAGVDHRHHVGGARRHVHLRQRAAHQQQRERRRRGSARTAPGRGRGSPGCA